VLRIPGGIACKGVFDKGVGIWGRYCSRHGYCLRRGFFFFFLGLFLKILQTHYAKLPNYLGHHGTTPDCLFRLPELQSSISKTTSSRVEYLHTSASLPDSAFSLAGNRFSGPILSSISKLTGLTQLKLGPNLLSGPIPYGIRQLKNLIYLTLEQNRLSGPIPTFFGSFPELRILNLSSNRFTGKIPPSISALAPKLAFLFQPTDSNLRG
jgi:hypothetical protein